MIRQIFAAVVGLGLVLSVAAQDTALRDGHPDEYVVQQGDTLWDIAARFLNQPWDWPAIWQANPQINNPHLIYPGDVISLVYIDGQPRLVLNRGEERLSPRIRDVSRDEAIPTIPLDAIDEFLREPRVVDTETFEGLPYVIANNRMQINALPGDRTYVVGLDEPVGAEVMVSRLNFIYRDADGDKPAKRDYRGYKNGRFRLALRPEHRDPYAWRWVTGLFGDDWPVVGYELWEIARARVVKSGDPAIIEILEGRREVIAGDYILPLDDYNYDANFYPSAMEEVPENARVLTVSDDRYHAAHFDIVALNIGSADGVRPGHTFATFRPGAEIHDERAHPYSRVNPFADKVTLPDEYVGQVMVFRAFEKVSYGMMLEGKRSVMENDVLRHADERL
ncbi:MAG: LysM peptidoglycan-binding domain-containing protein [Wenzhouxiangellaceae bacterium]